MARLEHSEVSACGAGVQGCMARPLYMAMIPSSPTVFRTQSMVPVYDSPRPVLGSVGWFITLVLITSAGVPKVAATKPATPVPQSEGRAVDF